MCVRVCESVWLCLSAVLFSTIDILPNSSIRVYRLIRRLIPRYLSLGHRRHRLARLIIRLEDRWQSLEDHSQLPSHTHNLIYDRQLFLINQIHLVELRIRRLVRRLHLLRTHYQLLQQLEGPAQLN